MTALNICCAGATSSARPKQPIIEQHSTVSRSVRLESLVLNNMRDVAFPTLLTRTLCIGCAAVRMKGSQSEEAKWLHSCHLAVVHRLEALQSNLFNLVLDVVRCVQDTCKVLNTCRHFFTSLLHGLLVLL